MIGMAAGMASEGRKVYTYAIAPFVTARVFEQNKLDLCAMNLPIVNLGIGAGYAYDIMGPSHHTVEDISIMRVLPHMKIYSPADGFVAAALAEISYRDPSPQYIRFDRAGVPDVYAGRELRLGQGILKVRDGKDVCLVATGIMVHQALKAASALEERRGWKVRVLDVCRLKPLNQDLLFRYIKNIPAVVTLEEHYLAGGLGSLIAETFVDAGVFKPLLRIGQREEFVFMNGGRQAIWEKYGLDAASVVKRIEKWLAPHGRRRRSRACAVSVDAGTR